MLDTLNLMAELTKNGRRSPAIREKAVELTAFLPQKDRVGEVRAIFEFVRDEIRYVRDIQGIETVHMPEIVLENAAGDCDDKAMLLASLLGSVGYSTRFVAMGQAPGAYTHVYLEVKMGRDWSTAVALDATEPHHMGWRPPSASRPIFFYN